MSRGRKIFLNTLVQFVGKIITASATLVTTILLARTFGVEGYGELTKITSYIAIFLLLIDFGFNAVSIPLMQTYGEVPIFSHLFFLRLFMAIFLSSISTILVFLIPGSTVQNSGFTQVTKMGILLLSPAIIFQGVFLSGNAIFQKNLRYDRSVISSALGSLVAVLLLAAIIFFRGGLLLALSTFTIGVGVAALSTLILLRRTFITVSFSLSPSFFKKILTASFAIGMTLLFNTVYLRSSALILTSSRTTMEVGIFGLAYKFFEFLLTIPTFFMNAVYPVLVERRHDKNRFQQTAIKAFLFLLVSSLVIFILGYIVAPLFILVKEEFNPSVVPFRILLMGLPFFYLSSLTMWFLITLEKRRELLLIYGSAMIASILLNILFVPPFGYLAASIITVLVEGYIFVVGGHVCLRELGRTPK